jgi:hypothetical protein
MSRTSLCSGPYFRLKKKINNPTDPSLIHTKPEETVFQKTAPPVQWNQTDTHTEFLSFAYEQRTLFVPVWGTFCSVLLQLHLSCRQCICCLLVWLFLMDPPRCEPSIGHSRTVLYAIFFWWFGLKKIPNKLKIPRFIRHKTAFWFTWSSPFMYWSYCWPGNLFSPRIWGSHNAGYEEVYLLGYNAI